jgi:hypothetical protein
VGQTSLIDEQAEPNDATAFLPERRDLKHLREAAAGSGDPVERLRAVVAAILETPRHEVGWRVWIAFWHEAATNAELAGIAGERTALAESVFADLIEEARRTGAHATFTEDYKSALQEWLQSRGRGLPVYRLADQLGPDHRKRFVVEVVVEGDAIAKAEGRSKKEAAQAAARAALEKLSA